MSPLDKSPTILGPQHTILGLVGRGSGKSRGVDTGANDCPIL